MHPTPPGPLETRAVTDCWSLPPWPFSSGAEIPTCCSMCGLHASASPAVPLGPLRLCTCSTTHTALCEPPKPREGGGKAGEKAQTHLPCQPPSQGYLTSVHGGRGAEPRAGVLLEGCRFSRPPTEETNHVFSSPHYHHCPLEFSPGAGSRAFVSGCLFLLASSSSAFLLPWRSSFIPSSSLEGTFSGLMMAIMIQGGGEWRERNRKHIV